MWYFNEVLYSKYKIKKNNFIMYLSFSFLYLARKKQRAFNVVSDGEGLILLLLSFNLHRLYDVQLYSVKKN